MESTNAAYLAGIVDGEGSIMLMRPTKKAKFRVPVVTISSTSLEIVERAKEIAEAGYICHHKKIKENHSDAYSLNFYYRPAITVCKNVLPYLVEKSKKVRALMIAEEYPKLTSKNGQYTAEQVIAKLEFETRFLTFSNRTKTLTASSILVGTSFRKGRKCKLS